MNPAILLLLAALHARGPAVDAPVAPPASVSQPGAFAVASADSGERDELPVGRGPGDVLTPRLRSRFTLDTALRGGRLPAPRGCGASIPWRARTPMPFCAVPPDNDRRDTAEQLWRSQVMRN
jgi:hypothetical protein